MAMTNNINLGMSLLLPTFDTCTSMSMDMQGTSKSMVPQITDKDVSNAMKRPKRVEDEVNMSYVDAMRSDVNFKDDAHWEYLRCMANALMEDCMKENAKIASEFDAEDIFKVEVDTKEYLSSFSAFYDRGVILFFTGKIPALHWVKQWLRGVLHADCVEDVYVGPRGFYEVVLNSSENKETLLARLPIFYGRSLVHVVPWRPLTEYLDILKQDCPVWVEVECKHSTMWPLLHSTIEKLGKILVPPNANAMNRYRMCILWNTAIKRPGCLQIDRIGMPPMYFKLKWGTFAGHCFHCGELGHFMAECPHTGKTLENHEVVEDIQEKLQQDKDPDLSMCENIEEQGVVIEKGPKSSDREGPWSVVSGRMNRFGKGAWNKSNEGMKLPLQQGSFGRSKNSGHQADFPKKLSFDSKGNLHNPWNKHTQVQRNKGNRSSVSGFPSHQNSFAILGDFFQDLADTLTEREKQVPSSKGKAKV